MVIEQTPLDTLAVRLEQARGMVAAVMGLYGDHGFNLDDSYLHMAIGAADQLLEQADDSLNAYLDDRQAKRGLR